MAGRTSNLGLVTQNVQWLLLLGSRSSSRSSSRPFGGYNAVQTGVIFTAATVGTLASSLAAERFAGRRTQKALILAGFVTAIAGTILVSDLASGNRSYALAMASLAGVGLIGMGAALLLPSNPVLQQA